MTWAIEHKGYSQRRACRLVEIEPKTYRYQPRRTGGDALRQRLRELAAERRGFGYRRLLILLRREGIVANHKRLYRVYTEEGLTVRKRTGRKRALGTCAPMTVPQASNQNWSPDFASDVLDDGRRFRVLVVVDDFSRECLALVVDSSLSGRRVARELDRIVEVRGLPLQIVSDNRPSAGGRSDPRSRRGQKAAKGHRADLTCHPQMAGGSRRGLALHRAGQAPAKWVRREPDRPVARRMPQRASVPQLANCPSRDRGLAARLQPRIRTPIWLCH